MEQVAVQAAVSWGLLGALKGRREPVSLLTPSLPATSHCHMLPLTLQPRDLGRLPASPGTQLLLEARSGASPGGAPKKPEP